MPEAPLFVSRNSAKGQKVMPACRQGRVCLPIGKARISPRQVQRDFNRPEGRGLASDSQNQNAKLVQRYLGHKAMVWPPMAKAIGHSDVATTLRYYVDVFPEDLEEAAEMLAER